MNEDNKIVPAIMANLNLVSLPMEIQESAYTSIGMNCVLQTDSIDTETLKDALNRPPCEPQ